MNLATGVVSGGHAQGDTLNDADTASGFQADFEEILGSGFDDSLTGTGGNGLAQWGGGRRHHRRRRAGNDTP